jgi:hypothetical protein
MTGTRKISDMNEDIKIILLKQWHEQYTEKETMRNKRRLVLGQGADDNNKSKDGGNNKSKDGVKNKTKDGDKNYTRTGTIRRKSKSARTQEGGQGRGHNRPGMCDFVHDGWSIPPALFVPYRLP